MKKKFFWGLWLCLYGITAFCQGHSQQEILLNSFFPAGKAIGQPFTSKQPCIRMVRVNSYQEAYDFFQSVCLFPDHLKRTQYKGNNYYRYFLPDSTCLIFTDKVIAGRNEVAILWIGIPDLNKKGIREIHFVQTIKIKFQD